MPQMSEFEWLDLLYPWILFFLAVMLSFDSINKSFLSSALVKTFSFNFLM